MKDLEDVDREQTVSSFQSVYQALMLEDFWKNNRVLA
jgi:hypothetical protein